MSDLRYCALMIERAWRGRTLPLRRCRNLAAKDALFCALHLRKLPVPMAPMSDDEAAWEQDPRTFDDVSCGKSDESSVHSGQR